MAEWARYRQVCPPALLVRLLKTCQMRTVVFLGVGSRLPKPLRPVMELSQAKPLRLVAVETQECQRWVQVMGRSQSQVMEL